MGGTSTTSQTQSQQSQLNPYDPASGALKGLLSGLTGQVGNAGLNGNQTGAINTLVSNAAGGDPNAGAIASGTTGLLNGGGAQNNDAAIKANLTNYQGLLQKTASGGNIGGNSALQPQLNQIATDATNQTNGAFAAAGRDGSPGNAQALGRGIAAGEAPVIANQYNQDTQDQMNAAGALYGAGNTTYGLLNGTQQTANGNTVTGATTLDPASMNANNYGANATLAAEAQRFGIPVSQYQTLLGSISPVAAQFGQQTGTGQSNGTSTMSGAQQFATIAGGIGNLMPKGGISFGAS